VTRSLRRVLALAVSAVLLHADRAPAQEAARLRVDAPPAESSVSTALVEVRGQAAAREIAAHDVVIVLDLSESSLLASGWDVDGDGPSGTTDPALLARLAARPDFPPGVAARLAEADFDDSVLAAELAAARALIERLLDGETRNRVGLVVFSDRARTVAPLGASRDTLDAALGALFESFHGELRGTNFGDAIGEAQIVLQPEVDGLSTGAPAGRDQSILLLSDGTPTLPPHGDRARQHALYAAAAAAAAHVRVFPFELSRQAPGRSVMAEIAERSGGRFERLERPGDAIARLRRTDLAGLAELRIVNRTTGAAARALRTFPDGSFDAFVELSPGANRIEIEARTNDGKRAVAERVVVREAAAAGVPDAQRTQLDELRRRTRETELWVEIERERRAPKTELDLRVEPMAPSD
jgi:hypothetical protein